MLPWGYCPLRRSSFVRPRLAGCCRLAPNSNQTLHASGRLAAPHCRTYLISSSNVFLLPSQVPVLRHFLNRTSTSLVHFSWLAHFFSPSLCFSEQVVTFVPLFFCFKCFLWPPFEYAASVTIAIVSKPISEKNVRLFGIIVSRTSDWNDYGPHDAQSQRLPQ